MTFWKAVVFFSIPVLCACRGEQKGKPEREKAFLKIVDNTSLKVDAGRAGEAFRYIDSVAASWKPLSVREQYSYYKFYCAYYLHYARKYDKAMAYADSMFRLIEQQQNKNAYTMELAEANYSIGDILFCQKRYSDSYNYFYKAKQVGKNAFNPCALSDYSYRMGMILYKQARYQPAARYFLQSFSESQICTDGFSSFYRKQELLNNTALCYTRLNNTDSALHYYEKALKLINANDGRFPEKKFFYEQARGVVYGNQGVICQQRGETALAEKLFRKSIAINSQPNYDNNDAQYVRLHLATLLLEQSRLAEMDGELREVSRNLILLPNADADIQLRDLLWKYYRQMGDDKNLLINLLAYNRLKDSLAKSNRDLTAADASEQLGNLEKQYEIRELKQRKEIDDLYFRILIVIAILSLAVIFLIYQNWRRSKNNIKELRGLNQQVTDQKVTLEQTLKELELRGMEKDRILRAVAHDLRNPIGGVASLSGFLLDDELTDDQREMLQLIHNTCSDGLLLINEILEISIISNITELPKEPIDINILLFNAIELLRFKANEKKQEIVLTGLPSSALVMANREKLGRVISNLISNAIKFSRIGGKINVGVERVNEEIRISVADNGIGIPESIKGKVFDTFTEAKRAGTSGEKPFGLGLSISKQIVEALNGRIWFESTPGNGSVFFVEFAAHQV